MYKDNINMIDFIKIVVYDKPQIDNIWNNDLLEFYETKEKRISIDEVKEYKIFSYKNLLFEKHFVNGKLHRLEISGSIHVLKNNGIHNANDFSFTDSINTIYQLKDLFNLDLTLCKIVNLEYGLNLIPKEDVKNIVLWLKYHNRNEFRYFPGLKYAKQSATFKTDTKVNKYKFIKAYAKGLQLFDGKLYGNKNTFRIEVKSKESKYINSLGIYTLKDLTESQSYLRLSIELLKEWENVLLLDMNLQPLNDARLNKYLSSDFWENSINQHRNHFSKHKQNYFSLLYQYPDNLHKNIHSLIENKLNQFEKEQKRGCKFHRVKNNKGVQIRPYIKVENAPVCKLTGIDISMQRTDSFLLSHTGLKYHYKNNPELFQRIKYKYLPKEWINSEFKIQIEKTAHNIRCCYNNRVLKQNRKYIPNQYSLF